MANKEVVVKKKKMHLIVFLAYLVLGVYFINFPFDFVKIPEYISVYNSWIVFAGGVFMLFGAINYFRVKKK